MENAGFLKELWEMAKLAGPFGTCILGVLYYLERKEKTALQARMDLKDDADEKYRAELLERVLTAINSANNALKGLTDMLAGHRR